MKVIRNVGEGRFLACFEKAAQPDYKGTLNTGKAVVFEAKLSTSDRIEQSRVTDHQAAALEAHSRMGAMAFVLVSLDFQSFYRVPWGTWRNMKQIYKRKYMTAAELEQYKVRFTGSRIEFLEV